MPLKILIVEDEPLIASDIQMTVEEAGHKVDGITNTSVNAFGLVRSRTPDLVLLDISIQGDKNGPDIGKILSNEIKVPFIYITSFADKSWNCFGTSPPKRYPEPAMSSSAHTRLLSNIIPTMYSIEEKKYPEYSPRSHKEEVEDGGAKIFYFGHYSAGLPC